MVFFAKIKLIALFVLILSAGSIVIHLSMTKYSSSTLVVDYATFAFPYSSGIAQGALVLRNKKLWSPVSLLEPLKPYSNPRGSFPVPDKKNNGFIYAKIFGGFESIRSAICDLVAISRLLNATLVIPEIRESVRSKGISYKFSSFSYLYDEEQFITALQNDVVIINTLPLNYKAAMQAKAFRTFKPKRNTPIGFYLQDVLQALKKDTVIKLIVDDGGCLEAILPRSMQEIQRLRCRVAFHALRFRSEIQLLGKKMVERLKAWGQPVLSYHPGLSRDLLAYHGCAELFQDLHTFLIQTRREQFIKQGLVKDPLNVDSHLRRDNGSCPLLPEEVGLLLRAMGYSRKTIVYIAGSETFGGQRVLIPLRSLFPNSLDRTVLCSKQELSDVIGPEITLPSDLHKMSPVKSEKQLKEEWDKAGPRPRPLPPPPDRPIYRHEKEGWYGWITEADSEPKPSISDTRRHAHRLLWDALDYIVSVEADAFFPGFSSDGSGWLDFSSLVVGQRLYERASARTYRPERKAMAALLSIVRDNMYHPRRNWTLSVREHLNNSLSFDGLLRDFAGAKPASLISHPYPECLCRMSSSSPAVPDSSVRYSQYLRSSEECPRWMSQGQQQLGSLASKEDRADDEPDYDDVSEAQEADESAQRSRLESLIGHDEEWDPYD